MPTLGKLMDGLFSIDRCSSLVAQLKITQPFYLVLLTFLKTLYRNYTIRECTTPIPILVTEYLKKNLIFNLNLP